MAPPTGIEVELKFKVADRAALDAVAAAVTPTKPVRIVRQENHFFDTPTRALNAAKAVLRLRQEDEKWFVTAKGRATGDSVLTSKVEIEREVDGRQALAILDGRQSIVAGFDSGSIEPFAALVGQEALIRLGSFTNQRTKVTTSIEGIEVTLELDATTFPGGIHHSEIEVEVPEGADAQVLHEAMMRFFERLSIATSSAPSKAQRFFAALDRH